MENINGGLYIFICIFILFIIYAIGGFDKFFKIYFTYYFKFTNKMKKINIDIYKSIFLLILGVFVYFYYQNSKIGRYTFTYDKDNILILDSKNGATYIIEDYYDGDKKTLLNTPSIIK